MQAFLAKFYETVIIAMAVFLLLAISALGVQSWRVKFTGLAVLFAFIGASKIPGLSLFATYESTVLGVGSSLQCG